MSPECARVMDAMGDPLPPELAAHAVSCPDCKAFIEGFESLDALPAAPSPSPKKLELTRTQSQKELAARPVPTPWWRELLVLLAGYAVMMGVGLLALSRNGLVQNAASPAVVGGQALLLLLLVAGGAFIALAPPRRPLSWTLVGAGAAGMALFQVLGGSGYADARGFVAGVLGCMTTEVVLTVPPLVLALVLLCRSVYQPVRALAAGLSAGGVGLFVLHLHCPDGSARHLMLGHVVPWLLLAGVALLLRARLPSRSYAP